MAGEVDDADFTNNWEHRLASGLYSLYRRQQFCDVTITAEDQGRTESIECHRSVLAAASAYLRDKLKPQESGAELNILEITSIHPHTVRKAVAFLYTGKCKITQQNLASLLELGNIWCVTLLVEQCWSFMVRKLTMENCVQYHELCIKSKATDDVKRTILQYIQQHFIELVQENKLNYLSLAGFTDILSHGRISKSDENVMYDEINNENVVFIAIVKWSEANPTLPVDALLPLIKYDLMTDEFLIDFVLQHNFLHIIQLGDVRKNLKFRLKRKNTVKTQTNNSNIPHQSYIRAPTVILSLNRYFDIASSCWKTLAGLPEWEIGFSSTCVHNSKIIFVGINYQCYLKDLKDDSKSCQLPKIPISLHSNYHHIFRHSVTYTGHEIYVSGGKSRPFSSGSAIKNSVYSLDLYTQPLQWKQCTPMLYGVCSHQSWYYRGHVYVVGGTTDRGCTRRTQKYNITTATWSHCAKYPEPIDTVKNKGLQINNEMHFFLPTKRITYNCDKDLWSDHQYNGFLLKQFACTHPGIHEDNIVICCWTCDIRPILWKYDIHKDKSSILYSGIWNHMYHAMFYTGNILKISLVVILFLFVMLFFASQSV